VPDLYASFSPTSISHIRSNMAQNTSSNSCTYLAESYDPIVRRIVDLSSSPRHLENALGLLRQNVHGPRQRRTVAGNVCKTSPMTSIRARLRKAKFSFWSFGYYCQLHVYQSNGNMANNADIHDRQAGRRAGGLLRHHHVPTQVDESTMMVGCRG
jgi:hypothetical protein